MTRCNGIAAGSPALNPPMLAPHGQRRQGAHFDGHPADMRRTARVADQPLATTGGGGGGLFPYGALPTTGNLPMIGIGALPTTGAGGGGWRVGISAANAALAKASVETVATRNFVM